MRSSTPARTKLSDPMMATMTRGQTYTRRRMGVNIVSKPGGTTESDESGTTGWDRRQERTRREVLVAARQLISAGGLEALTMRKLGSEAGVSVATLYNQFGDRNGVLVAIVSHGLDQMELAVDGQPSNQPIDTTRALFEALDATISGAVDVWRPVFTILKAGSGTQGIGAVGNRAAQIIEHDLAKAAADGLLIAGCNTALLARHILTARMNRLEKWATGVIEWDAYQESSRLGLELLLAAVLDDRAVRLRALALSGVIDGSEA